MHELCFRSSSQGSPIWVKTYSVSASILKETNASIWYGMVFTSTCKCYFWATNGFKLSHERLPLAISKNKEMCFHTAIRWIYLCQIMNKIVQQIICIIIYFDAVAVLRNQINCRYLCQTLGYKKLNSSSYGFW